MDTVIAKDRAIILTVLVLALTPMKADATIKKKPEAPVREARIVSISFHAGRIGFVPGVRVAANVTPHIGLDGTLYTLGLFTELRAGLRGYLLESGFSPYLSLGGSVIIAAIFDTVDAGGAFTPAAGLEYTTHGGFTVYVEGGAMICDGWRSLPTFAWGIGYRF
jgi:hypothetical protein